MYTEFFQLREMPFSITPDPAYLYMSPRHQEALGHLLYGTGQYGGFVQITGEVGTGKTTIVRSLLDQKLPDVDVAMIHNPRQSEQEFVHSICDELGVEVPRDTTSIKVLVDALNAHLLKVHAAGRRTVLIIDEAQNLQPGVLEQVRLLTNLETAKAKLLRIMLVGQPELSTLLGRPELRQLASRITARYHLQPLSERETAEYIGHRLRIAGARSPIFEPAACSLVHRYAQGIPRLINVICDRALLGAYSQQALRVDAATVRRAAREVMGEQPALFEPDEPRRWRAIETGWLVALIACAALFAYTFWPSGSRPPAPAHAVRAADTPPTPAPSASPHPAASPTAGAFVPAALPLSPAEDLARTAQPLSAALARLIGLWGAETPVAATAELCTSLQTQGLECYRSSGDWEDLFAMDRPAVLGLDIDGSPQYVLLESLDTRNAVLHTALGPMQIAVAELRPLWTGEFLLLWRRESHAIRIDAEAGSADVAWLHDRLVELGYADGEPPQMLDASLVQAVRRFQADRGLAVDGIAGVRTLIELGDALPDTPTLAMRAP
ncbi:ExeA family protein [Sinimarinibacterium flocculans]|uniref:ExeA family protein n=1 Tax=Sinimarinibacterium flocculans TaxID=985250 RepID=UPI003514E4AE